MSENKTQPTPASVDAFLDSIENEQRREDSRKLVPIFERLTGEKATLWGPAIVGFGKYHYKYESGREGDAPLAGFSPRKNDLTVYLSGGFQTLFADQLARLGKHKASVSCLYLKRLADVDLAVLEEMVLKVARMTRQKYSA